MNKEKVGCLSLRVKKQDPIIITVGGEKIELRLAGFDRGTFQVILQVPKSVNIIRQEVLDRKIKGGITEGLIHD